MGTVGAMTAVTAVTVVITGGSFSDLTAMGVCIGDADAEPRVEADCFLLRASRTDSFRDKAGMGTGAGEGIGAGSGVGVSSTSEADERKW